MSEPGVSGLPQREGRAAPVELSARMSGPSGAPVLVLGNSLGTTMELWEPQLDVLGRRFRLLRYEHRGHGGSPAPPGPYAIADLGADVLALLDEFEVATAYYAGVSLGGMVGMWLGSISKQVVARWFTSAYEAAHPGTVAWFVTTLQQDVAPEGYAGCCDAIAAMDLRPLLASITAPTLVVAGAEDPATPPWHGAVIASAITRARLRVIRGAAHLANVSSAAEFAATLLAHLAA